LFQESDKATIPDIEERSAAAAAVAIGGSRQEIVTRFTYLDIAVDLATIGPQERERNRKVRA